MEKERETLLRRREVQKICGLSPASLYRAIKAGCFPKPRLLGRNLRVWRAGEIQAFIEALPEATITPPSAALEAKAKSMEGAKETAKRK